MTPALSWKTETSQLFPSRAWMAWSTASVVPRMYCLKMERICSGGRPASR